MKLEVLKEPRMCTADTSKLSKYNRVDRLISGFLRLYREMPSDIVRLTFDFYYCAHDEWLNQTLTIHIADERHDRRHGSFLYGAFVDASPVSFGYNIELGHTPDLFDDQYNHSRKYPLWRVSPSTEDHGLTLTLADVDRSDSIAVLVQDIDPWDSKTRLSLSFYSRITSIQLHLQQPDLDKDEYCFQSTCDGRYVAVTVEETSYSTYPSLELTDDASQATLFGLTQRHLPQLPTDKVKSLKSGSRVLHRVPYYSWDGDHYDVEPDKTGWVIGRVRDKRRSAFGYEVRIDYHGFVEKNEGFEEVSGKTPWIPITSWNIDLIKAESLRFFDDEVVAQFEIGEDCQAYWDVYCEAAESRVLHEREGRRDRFARGLKSRRKSEAKGKRKQERRNEIRGVRRSKRKDKKYGKVNARRVDLS